MISSRTEALEWLFGRLNYERSPLPYRGNALKLERMRQLLSLLGEPLAGKPIVHVAGSKGKGSTAAMIAAVAGTAGYRTGLFTSPHLEQIEERFVVDGQACTSEEFVQLAADVQPVAAAMDQQGPFDDGSSRRVTFFEIVTAMGMLHFARQNVDLTVLEVGLGGRLDSTNVCLPAVSVITSISFDHMRQLGNTLAAIAREKAGIIKPGVPVVSGVRAAEAHAVIAEVAAERGSRLVELDRDFAFDYQVSPAVDDVAVGRATVRIGQQEYPDLRLALLGRHQAANAAVAVATLNELNRQGWRIDGEAIAQGLANVHFPARVEVLSRQPLTILDAAHNAASIEALVRTLDESFPPRRRVLVFAATREKDVRGMLEVLLPRFDHTLFTMYQDNPRGLPVADLVRAAEEVAPCSVSSCPTPADVPERLAAIAGPDDLVCVTGSVFLAAELRPILLAALRREVPALS